MEKELMSLLNNLEELEKKGLIKKYKRYSEKVKKDIIIFSINNEILIETNVSTTTTNDSTINYNFLNKQEYNLLNEATKKNIEKNIKNLNEEKFKEIYYLTIEYLKQRSGNFNAILFQGLKDEWNFDIKKIKDNSIDEAKEKWLSYFSGIADIKDELREIIKDIPIDVLEKNKKMIGMSPIKDFKNLLLKLKR